jgi:hypothetical protein
MTLGTAQALEAQADPPAVAGTTPVLATAAPMAESAPRRSRRRRLWELPTQAHELLLALSFTPDVLRREAARTLGQIHKGHCVLKGRDVDVLYSVVNDLTVRNALSEAMQKHLDARHALALRTVVRAKDEQALRALWDQALADDTLSAGMPAMLWAVLTHPLGESVQTRALYDARAWVFAHARRSVGQELLRQQADTQFQQLRQRANDLQGRLNSQQKLAAEALQQAQAEITRLRGELVRAKALAPGQSAPQPSVHRTKHSPVPNEIAVLHRTPDPSAPAVATSEKPATPPPTAAAGNGQGPAESPPAALDVAGRRVLCVGGIQHAVSRYRGRIEKLGGRFEHHDGGIEDGIQALDARLGRADVVICQAACINHEAYHRVKRYCERTGTPCVYLDRPSLSRLDRALSAQPGALHASR